MYRRKVPKWFANKYNEAYDKRDPGIWTKDIIDDETWSINLVYERCLE